MSLELGGSPNSPHNLWPQPGGSPNPKDKLETALDDLVCSNRMTLTDAQTAIAGDWVSTYRHVLGRDPAPCQLDECPAEPPSAAVPVSGCAVGSRSTPMLPVGHRAPRATNNHRQTPPP